MKITQKVPSASSDIFKEQTQSSLEQFRTLCSSLKEGSKSAEIVFEGSGDVFEGKIWPKLKKIIENEGKVRAWVTDIKPMKSKYTLSKEASSKLKFIDKSLKSDSERYSDLSPDFVVVLAPDAYHLRIAGKWLGEDMWIGRTKAIFMEKPYDRSLFRANKFERKLPDLATIFVPFDHYLAKIYEFIKVKDDLMEKIGELETIRFSLLEEKEIPKGRAPSLQYGIAYDMLPHPLAIISTVCELDELDFEVGGARYINSPIGNADTYSLIEGHTKTADGDSVEITGSVGKGIGKTANKRVIMEGTDGHLTFDFSDRMGIWLTIGDREPIKWRDIYEGHPEFIDSLLTGNWIENPIGALTRKKSISILGILTEARQRLASIRLPTYRLGDNENSVFRKAEKTKL